MTSTTKIGTLIAILLAAGCSSSSSTNQVTNPPVDAGPTATDDSSSPADDASSDTGSSSTPANYPPGPYGVAVGAVLDPSLQWQGFPPGATTATTVKITDFFDPDGSKGVNALILDSSGQWCVACQGVAQQIPNWMSASGENYTKLGVQLLSLIIQNNDYEPATITTAQQWRDLFNLNSIVYVVADPNDTFPTPELPYELLVDPRTMKVTHNLTDDNSTAADGSDPAVLTLAKMNGAK